MLEHPRSPLLEGMIMAPLGVIPQFNTTSTLRTILELGPTASDVDKALAVP